MTTWDILFLGSESQMVSKETKIVNRTGLHARPASTFVVEAKKYKSHITVCHVGGGQPVNAKSIMMILAGGFNHGDDIVIECEGPDEQEALDGMIALIESGCGEIPQ